MTVLVTLSAAGTNTTLFNLYSNIDYNNALATNITKANLLAGYNLLSVPNNATTIRVKATGACTNSVDLTISNITTSSTSSTSTTSSTTLPTTSTSTSTTSSTTTAPIVTIPTVAICGQSWASANLNVDRYANGEIIPQSTTAIDWAAKAAAGTGAWCYYDFNPANGPIYGKLYNWYAVNDNRGLAPIGYHISSLSEWSSLHTCLGGNNLAGGKLKEPGTSHWSSPNPVLTPYTGFASLPGGMLSVATGQFGNLHDYGSLWTSTETDAVYSYAIAHEYASTYSFITGYEKGDGLSVRVILGNAPITSTTSSTTSTTTSTTTTPPTTSTSTSTTTTSTTTAPPINCEFIAGAQEIIPVSSVVICNREWSTTNLDVSRYRDGTPIAQATSTSEWLALKAAGIGAWCYHRFDPAFAYGGKNYNWNAVNDPRGLAPIGWHIPTKTEWTDLANCLGGTSLAGGKLKLPGTTYPYWASPNATLTPYTGFAAIPVLSCSNLGTFDNTGFRLSCGMWSSTLDSSGAWTTVMNYTTTNLYINATDPESGEGNQVRLIKDL